VRRARQWRDALSAGRESVVDVMHLPSDDPSLDCNGNGICDAGDLLASTSEDCDGDGVVGVNDLLRIINAWGSCV
jgi:hypothetical protein